MILEKRPSHSHSPVHGGGGGGGGGAQRHKCTPAVHAAARGLLLLLLVAGFAAKLHQGPSENRWLARRQLNPAVLDNAELLAGTLQVQSRQQQQAQRPARQGGGNEHYGGPDRTLSFPVCGGFATQRAALVSGNV